MKNCELISLTLLTLFGACSHGYKEEIIIRDLAQSKTDTILFEIATHQSIYKKVITVRGQTNGSVRVEGFELHPGKIDTVFSGDWDSSIYILRYESIDASQGFLKIDLELQAKVNF